MAKGAQAVDEASSVIAGHLATLDQEITGMEGKWKGEAAASFQALHRAWREQQSKLQSALVDMHSALVSTQQTYQAQEEQQASAFSHIAGAL